MTQEEKNLLLKDLCARLPFGVKVLYDNQVKELQYIEAVYNEVKLLDYTMNYTVSIEEIKPYLFPLSSMTEEQNLEYLRTCRGSNADVPTLASFEWLNKNHFDYRGLIPMRLAKDATGLNIY